MGKGLEAARMVYLRRGGGYRLERATPQQPGIRLNGQATAHKQGVAA